MLVKKITYTDLNDIDQEREYRFNLTKTELTEMELSVEGGLVEKMAIVTEKKDGKEIMAIFKDVIKRAYGEKSADGQRFIKSDELSLAFMQSPAYDVLFMEIMNDPKAAATFINAIIPKLPNPPPAFNK